MATVSVRYIVNDIDAAIGFYTGLLGFSVLMRPNDMFAMLTRGDLRLVLSVAGNAPGGGQAMPPWPNFGPAVRSSATRS